MEVKTYEDDDLDNPDYREGEHPWQFIADLPGDNPDLFGDFDNHMMTDRLKRFGAIKECDVDDPEMCCSYVYFKNKAAGRRFIKKLNEYILEKARLIEQARSF